MDLESETARLCILGTQAEFAHRPQDARECYARAWQAARDDVEACIAAHYVARFQDTPQETLRWNLLALEHALAGADPALADFFPSLYLNLGQSYAQLGDPTQSAHYYRLAADLGFEHQA